jgi:hypothetical protein
MESTTGATVQMCLIAVWDPSSLVPGPPPTTYPRQTLFWMNAFAVAVPDRLQPRRVATLLSNLNPSRSVVSNLAEIITSSWSLSDAANPCFHHIVQQPLHPSFRLFGPSLFRILSNHLLVYISFFLERAPSALAALGTFVLVHSF